MSLGPSLRSTFALLALLTGCANPPPGEIDLYKVQVQESFVHTDRTSNTFTLRGRGFILSENFGRIIDAFGEYTHVGPLRLLRNIDQLREETLRAWTRMKSDGQEQSPTAKRLLEIRSELDTLRQDLEKRISSFMYQEPRTLILTDKAKREVFYDTAVDLLRGMRFYLEHLQETAASAVRNRSHPYGAEEISKRFDIIFEVAGRPLTAGDWSHREGMKGSIELRPERYDLLFKPVQDAMQEMFKYIEDLVPPTPTLIVRARKPTETDLEQLKEYLRSITEGALNLSNAIRLDKSKVDPWGEAYVTEDGQEKKLKRKDPHDYDGALDRIRLDIQKARAAIQRILDRLDEPIEQIASGYSDEKVKLEGFAREFSILTHRDYNRPLRRSEKTDDTPVYLTIILKTLYLKHVGDATANTPLLVTCAIKTAANAEEAVYPIIFERDFTPGQIVNRKDRIAYGPYPYKGEFLDFRITVVQLNDVKNEAMISGFSKISAAAGAFNPQLAVLSPIVTGLFGTLVHAINRNLMELDASFTFAGQKRDDKPEEDMLVSETGHYIILKRENPARYLDEKAKSSGPRHAQGNRRTPVEDSATQNMLYRWLIFNPEDNRLYWRRFFNNPRDNFTPENEFREQSYAVLAVTDEYPSQDELGTILRKQVAQALGEERAKQIIPDLGHSAQLLKEFKDLRRDEQKVKAMSNEKERSDREAELKKKKDDLWKDLSAIQKQMITDVLYDTADPATRAALGTDPDKWKRADIVVGLDGMIQRRANPLLSTLKVVPKGELFQAFPEKDPKLNWKFTFVKPEAEEGRGVIDEKGMYKPPDTPAVASVVLRASAAGPDGPVTLERAIQFKGDQDLKARIISGTTVLQEGEPGRSLSREFLLSEAKQTIKIEVESRRQGLKVTPVESYTWKVAGSSATPDQSKLPPGVSNLTVGATKQFATFDIEPGKLERTADGFTLVAIPDPFVKIFDGGTVEGIPAVSLAISLRNPLSFEAAQVVIHWKDEAKPVLDDTRPVLDKRIQDKAKPALTGWTIAVDGETKGASVNARVGENLELKAEWFSRKRTDGTIVVSGDVELEGNVKLPVRRAIPYRIEK